MGSFDLGDVEETCCVADEGATWEGAFGNRLEAAFVQRARAVGNALTAFKVLGELGVVFHLLEFAVGGQPGVWVVQADDEADGDEVVAEVVHPGAAVGV